ncbi:uncharacterized protein LOC110854237 [Folsomia candida]|uniref:Uncharacterized protein n=1 Tax=Folsomia candida TaxID=158441 RepID=A0A226DZ87_FOLCA|nr:uncharacterized protein LOC110854237 [Folsomia candida]OXA50529.1 hypothetical protein Fcan01_14720 [Folsomia candida]
MKWTIFLTYLFWTCTSLNFFISPISTQSTVSGNNCTQILRGVRRAGANMAGRLEIPLDAEFPKFQVRLKFNRALHHITFRQLRAKDVGSRREFLIEPFEVEQNGVMKINTFMRLNNLFSPSPKLIGVTYNGKLLCGENVFDDSVLIELKTSTKRSIPIIVDPTKQPKDHDEEDEVFN